MVFVFFANRVSRYVSTLTRSLVKSETLRWGFFMCLCTLKEYGSNRKPWNDEDKNQRIRTRCYCAVIKNTNNRVTEPIRFYTIVRVRTCLRVQTRTYWLFCVEHPSPHTVYVWLFVLIPITPTELSPGKGRVVERKAPPSGY